MRLLLSINVVDYPCNWGSQNRSKLFLQSYSLNPRWTKYKWLASACRR